MFSLTIFLWPTTYSQLYIPFVFAVQERMGLIQSSWEEDLFKYITGIIKNHKHKMIAINGMPDHIHLLVGLHPTESISSVMQIVKGESSQMPEGSRLLSAERMAFRFGLGSM